MLFGVVLALTVLGCRKKEHTYEPDETNPPSPTPGATELEPPLIEDDDEIGDDDDLTHEGPHDAESEQEAPPPVSEPPVDPDMPEAGDPGADPKQPPPPSKRETRG
jgi:hypothetical protein